MKLGDIVKIRDIYSFPKLSVICSSFKSFDNEYMTIVFISSEKIDMISLRTHDIMKIEKFEICEKTIEEILLVANCIEVI